MLLAYKQKIILQLLADGGFHSGTDIAKQLGISRAAVWQNIESLSELGLNCSAVRGKGYKLTRPLALLKQELIYPQLSAPARAQLSQLEIHDQLDSTNRYLAQRAEDNAPCGSVCFAEYQTAGKGRRGRQWQSPFGHNLYLSILWRFSEGFNQLAGLSLVIGLAVIRALRIYQQTQKVDFPVQLKWPNDIVSNQKKLGGILIEVSGESEGLCSAVIGIGLNTHISVQAGQQIDQAWTDLSQLTGQTTIARNHLASLVLEQCLLILAEFSQHGLSPYLAEWRAADALINQPATLFLGSQTLNGIVRGIDDKGLLRLEHADGVIRSFASGEVSFHS